MVLAQAGEPVLRELGARTAELLHLATIYREGDVVAAFRGFLEALRPIGPPVVVLSGEELLAALPMSSDPKAQVWEWLNRDARYVLKGLPERHLRLC